MSVILSQLFSEQSPGKRLLKLITDKCPEMYVSGVRGSALGFFASQVFDALKKSILIVARTTDDAQEIYQELLFFRNQQTSHTISRHAAVLQFSALDTQPYENVLSHCDISAQRLWTLYNLCESTQPCIIVTSIRAIIQKILPHDILIDSCRRVVTGDELDRDRLCSFLIENGYARVSLVEDRGDLSVRGEVLDIYPPGYANPVRLDFFGDCVETIRLFDPINQRSYADLHEIVLVPVREIILRQGVLDDFQKRLVAPDVPEVLSQGKGDTFCENIRNGLLPSGVEYGLSFIYSHLETLFDYLPDDCIVFFGDRRETDTEMAAISADIDRHYHAALDEKRIISPPHELFLQCNSTDELNVKNQHVFFESLDVALPGEVKVGFNTQANDDIRSNMITFDTPTGALAALAEQVEQWGANSITVFLVCHTTSQCERLSTILSDYGLQANISQDRTFVDIISQRHTNAIEICVGKLDRGFRYEEGLIVVITEEEIFGEKKRRIAAPHFKRGTAISDFSDLQEGNIIVHRENGMGIYRGLETLDAGGLRADYLSLEYLGGDKLYLPVDRINFITKYEGTEDTLPRLDKLGGSSWQRTKKRVKQSVEKIARDLIELYSARKVYKGHAFSPPDHYYREFEASFPYEETSDQLAAITDVMGDMSHDKPMDRLICGDVGYGKTEVALRAAFRAAMDGKQVAVFVPTTVLAQQHYQTFKERFAPYPIRVDILSRFRKTRAQKNIIRELAEGKIDIIIGTHRLISKDVMFRDLGLIVVDEEHRFGVKHKEKLKKIKATVDVLTLTATPIPRTLQLSLLSIRDFSVIETPPEDRLSIRTVITGFDDGVIKDATLRELKRGGQVFFVHDRVRSIPAMSHYLRRLIPEMKLGIAHGQMNERELEKSMLQFINKEINVLLCTTIIESGLDFPTANTIIIHNAHRLGLAQMYQLRGRVGRGKVRAYAYLLIPGKSVLNRDAVRRLEALTEFTELGSGYRLATRDLQIRGAGNILGHSQSGHIAAVGVDMYLELLHEAITELKGEKAPPQIDPEVNLNIQAFIPETYVGDVNQRLVLYRRIASVTQDDETRDVEEELRDRFGKLPAEVENLLEIARLKNFLRGHLVVSVDFFKSQLVFAFHEEAEASLEKILSIVASDQHRFRFTPEGKLFAAYSYTDEQDILGEIRNILQ